MKKFLAISMAIMIAAIVIMPVLGYTGGTAENQSYSVDLAGNQSYTASSAGSQSYTATSTGNLSNTVATTGREGYSISTGVAAHELTPEMVTEVNSVSTSPVQGMRVPYSIKYGSILPYSIKLGSSIPYSIKQGSITTYSIKQSPYTIYSIELMDVSNTRRDTYQTVKMEPMKLGSIASREAVVLAVEGPSVVETEIVPIVEEITLNETVAPNETVMVEEVTVDETVSLNESAVVEEVAVDETVPLNETTVAEEVALNETVALNDTLAINETFVFSWTKVPGTDEDRLKEYLAKRYNIDWIYTAGIVKSEDGKTIDISQENKILSLALNDEESEVLLKIDNITTDKFIARMENGELNIYNKTVLLNETAAVIESAPVEAIMTESVAGAAVTEAAATAEPAVAEVVTEAAPVEVETVEMATEEVAPEEAPVEAETVEMAAEEVAPEEAPVEAETVEMAAEEVAPEEAPVEAETVESVLVEAAPEAAPLAATAEPAPAETVTAEAAPVAAAAQAATTSDAAKPGQGYTIEGVVFEDLNGNGVKNVNEEGLANWTVNLEQPEGVVIKSVNSAADGKFVFLNQLPGLYTIKQVLQPGWTLISPAEGKLTVEVINESVTHLGFANKRS